MAARTSAWAAGKRRIPPTLRYAPLVADERELSRIETLVRRPQDQIRRTGRVQPAEAVHSATEALANYQSQAHPRAAPEARTPSHIEVREVMTTPVRTLPTDSTLGKAAALMDAGQFRHVPIVHKEHLAGLLTRWDIARRVESQPSGWYDIPIGDVMTTEVIVTVPGTTLREAAQLLLDSHHSGLPVIDPHTRPVGFLSARDVLKVLVGRAPLTLWV